MTEGGHFFAIGIAYANSVDKTLFQFLSTDAVLLLLSSLLAMP
jgi:hypothetical protein